MTTESTQLIHRGNLEKTLSDLLAKEKALLEAGKGVLPSLDEGHVKTTLKIDLAKRRTYVEALEGGFVPVDGRGFVRTDTKDKWNKTAVKVALARMPEEAKQAWEEAKELGVFSSFSVSPRRGGDPVLVGNAGGRPFLVACWVCIVGGTSVRFRFRQRRKDTDGRLY